MWPDWERRLKEFALYPGYEDLGAWGPWLIAKHRARRMAPSIARKLNVYHLLRDDLEDISSDAASSFVKNFDPEIGPSGAYLASLVRSQIVTHIAKSSRRNRIANVTLAGDLSDQLELSDGTDEVGPINDRLVLSGLLAGERPEDVDFILRYVQDNSTVRTAAERQRMSRLRARLRHRLELSALAEQAEHLGS